MFRFDLLWLIADKSDREQDLRLAKHITYVHQHNINPPLQHDPIDMKLMRRYVALCQKKNPDVPKELTEFIVGSYCELRKESRNIDNQKSSTFTSARTLLAILRLSTSLARLRLVDQVEKEDVIEAMRLMEMSKDSLKQQEQYDGAKRRKTRSDEIYDLIRTMAAGSKTLKIPEIKERYNRVYLCEFNLIFLKISIDAPQRDLSLMILRSALRNTSSWMCGSSTKPKPS